MPKYSVILKQTTVYQLVVVAPTKDDAIDYAVRLGDGAWELGHPTDYEYDAKATLIKEKVA